MSLYKAWGKRSLDIAAATVGMVVLSPVLAVVAVLVRTKLGSPVIYKQQRPGLSGKIFTLYKFRTMRDTVGPDGQPLADDVRLTPFGKALRSTSLDELPELWNILRGEMSFVGPRPLRVEYLPLYSKKQSRRHEVLPGLTGLAQVSGRNTVDWPTKFRLDIEYVDSINLRMDFKIITLTVRAVLSRSGVSGNDHVTAEFFRGEE